MPAQANPQARNFLASLLMGGRPGGDPYANQSQGPFATSPRIYGRQQPMPPPAAAARPAPAPGGGGGKGGAGKGGKAPARAAAPGTGRVPLPVQNPRNTVPGTYTIGAEGNMPNVPLGPGGPGGGTQTGQPPPAFTPPARPYSPTPPSAALNMVPPMAAGRPNVPFSPDPSGGAGGGAPAPGGAPASPWWSFGFNDAVRDFERQQGRPSTVPREPGSPAANVTMSTPATGSGSGIGSGWWNWLTGITGGR